jgi:hypothetical protein
MATTGSLDLLERTLVQTGAIIAHVRPEQGHSPGRARPANGSAIPPADDATADRGTG